jgi:hypothetical protein
VKIQACKLYGARFRSVSDPTAEEPRENVERYPDIYRLNISACQLLAYRIMFVEEGCIHAAALYIGN